MAEEVQEVVQEAQVPPSLDEILADLRGFGIEEFEEILTIELGARALKIRLSNIPTDDDLAALVAVEGKKDYQFFQEVKAEILSRAISWINGIDLRKREGKSSLVRDPKNGEMREFRAVLRDTIKSWGVEVMQMLWKVLMVHMQTIEDRVFSQFPDAAKMTDVERRYLDRVQKEVEETTRAALQQRVDELLDEPLPEEGSPSSEVAVS